MIARAPSSIAFATATTIPRSLKEPVGLQLSSLKYSAPHPTSASIARDLTSGVSPSPSEIIGVASVTGRRSRWRYSTPRCGASSRSPRATLDVMLVVLQRIRLDPQLFHVALQLVDLLALHPFQHEVELQHL